jgi:hypothetical protein
MAGSSQQPVADTYAIDWNAITLRAYAAELKDTVLIPSRRILQEQTDIRFFKLERLGIRTLADLLVALRTPAQTAALAKRSGLPAPFLQILKREVTSMQPKPIKLMDFPVRDRTAFAALARYGIADSRQLLTAGGTPALQKALNKETGVSVESIRDLARLADVSRIRWVGANLARLLVDAGSDSAAKVARADPETLYTALLTAQAKRKDCPGRFGLNDIRMIVRDAQRLCR